MSVNSIYVLMDDVFIPTKWAGGPWTKGLHHGGPINALFARAAELAADESGLQVVRLTVDLFKPIPTVPLTCQYRFVRRGRRIANVEMEIALPGENTPLSKATAVLLERRDDLGRTWQPEAPSPPDIEKISMSKMIPQNIVKHLPEGFHRSLEAGFGEDAEGLFAVIDTPLDLIEDEKISPLQRSAALADLTFGLSIRLQSSDMSFGMDNSKVSLINADTTLQWERPPEKGPICFRDILISDEAGIGVASVSLFDAKGRMGKSTQVLIAQKAFNSQGPKP